LFLKIDNAEENLWLPQAHCPMAISADSPLNSLTDLIISNEVSHLIFGSMTYI